MGPIQDNSSPALQFAEQNPLDASTGLEGPPFGSSHLHIGCLCGSVSGIETQQQIFAESWLYTGTTKEKVESKAKLIKYARFSYWNLYIESNFIIAFCY